MGRRLSRGNALAGGEQELLANYAQIDACFATFFPDLVKYAARSSGNGEREEARSASSRPVPLLENAPISGRGGVGG
jgi:hypothetical protein